MTSLAKRLGQLAVIGSPKRTVDDVADVYVVNSMCMVIVPHAGREVLAVAQTVRREYEPDVNMEMLGCSLVITAAGTTP